MTERWRPIVTDTHDYSGVYEVSNLGRVKSLKRAYVPTDRIMIGGNSGRGYLAVVLRLPGGEAMPYLVHRLVANAFLPNPKGLPVVHHRDGVKTNNTARNLKWVTYKKNSSYYWQEYWKGVA